MPYGRRVAFVALAALASGLLLQSCANGERGPIGPSPAAQIPAPPGRIVSWQCAQQGTTVTLSGGWSFTTPAANCPAAFSAPADVAVGAVSAAPANFRSTVTGSTVRLDWNGIGEPVSSFRIEAGSAPTLANLATLNTGNAAVTLTVTNVPNGAYYVRVRAVGGDGVPGPPSNEIVVRVGGVCAAAPLAPTAFTSNVVGNLVNLSWLAAAGGDVPATYFVDAGSASTLSNIIVFDTGSAATALAVTAPNGVYYVRLRAVNACGSSAPSNEIVINVPTGGGGGETVCTYNVSPPSVALTNSGGEFSVNVSTNPSCAWSAAPLSGFITLTSPANASGAGTARFSAGSNNTGQQRQGGVRISWANGSQDVSITQAATASGGGGGGGGTTCTYAVTPTTAALQSVAGTFDVTVTTGPTCAWSATAATFATVSGATVTGTGTARFSVQANTGSARNGTARITWTGSEQGIAISQAAPPPPPPPTAPQIDNTVTVPSQPEVVNNQLVAQPPPSPFPNAGAGPVLNSAMPRPAGGSSLFVDLNAAGTFDTVLIAPGTTGANGAPTASSYRVLSLSSARTSATIQINVVSGQPATTQFAVTLGSLLPANYVPQTVSTTNQLPRFTSPGCSFAGITPGGTISCPATAVDDDSGDLITWTPTASHTCSWFGVSAHSPANPSSVTLGGVVPAEFTGTCNININACDQRLGCIPWTGSYTWNAPLAPTALFTFAPDPCTISGSGPTVTCTFNASGSTAGSGTITTYIWTYLGTTVQTAGPTLVPVLGCGISGAQQVTIPVTLQVKNSFGLTSTTFALNVAVRKVNACGFGQ